MTPRSVIQPLLIRWISIRYKLLIGFCISSLNCSPSPRGQKRLRPKPIGKSETIHITNCSRQEEVMQHDYTRNFFDIAEHVTMEMRIPKVIKHAFVRRTVLIKPI